MTSYAWLERKVLHLKKILCERIMKFRMMKVPDKPVHITAARSFLFSGGSVMATELKARYGCVLGLRDAILEHLAQ